jgi:hypothetical protein
LHVCSFPSFLGLSEFSPSPMASFALPSLTPFQPHSHIGPARALPCPACPDISLNFFARGLLFALMMEAVSSSETSVNIYQTRGRNIREGSHLPQLAFTTALLILLCSFEVLTELKMSIVDSWVVRPCRLVGGYHLQGRWWRYVFLRMLPTIYKPTWRHNLEQNNCHLLWRFVVIFKYVA